VTTDLGAKFGPMPTIPFEIVEGSMSILRIGPVTVPLLSMVRIAMRSEMQLLLRSPRLEIQIMPGVAMNCEIVDIWVGEERPNVPQDRDALGVIRPGELLQAILQNHMSQNANASVVVEGDEVRVVHWGALCVHKDGGGCANCRWRTRCRHEECERSPEMEWRCHDAREQEELRKIATTPTAAGGVSGSSSLWRPWNPLT